MYLQWMYELNEHKYVFANELNEYKYVCICQWTKWVHM